MKTILVTGGAGFIGSHLCEALLAAGNRVVCVDNLFCGSKKNIAPCLKNKNFVFVQHDITVPFETKEKISEIYNLACPASPVNYQKDPVFTIETSFIGTHNMLKLAKKHGARMLQASTSEVYGDPLEHPQRETYWGNVNPIGIRACYDEGKRAAETLCFDYHREKKVDIRVVRIFNTYGPRMAVNDGRVVSNFIVQALRGAPITIYGDGAQTRSFQYVDDLIVGMMAFMKKTRVTGPVNFGNPTEFTMVELAQKVIHATKSKSEISFRTLPGDDPKRRRPDISVAKKMLGWTPVVPLDEGLKKTIAYFKKVI
jgi:UDP-glucuronate decarboxylase